MEFTEYRQPWETGPHWELKREFLEFYKDNFTEERLLCLAQAYSNIELLHCSYPAQVMLQIHELSKPLQGCKRFRGNGNAQSNHQNTEKQQRKRKGNEPASSQKFKFIKFCTGSDNSEKQEANQSNYDPLLPSFSSIDYESITDSENFNILKKLSEEIKKILEYSKENSYDIILSAALHSNVESLIDLKFTNETMEGANVPSNMHYCEFFIGMTKIAIGHGENRYVAKTKASENALYILTHLKESSKKSDNNVQAEIVNEQGTTLAQKTSLCQSQKSSSKSNSNDSSLGKSERKALKKFALEIKKESLKPFTAVTIIHNCAVKLKMSDDVIYNILQDPNFSKHATLFLCDLFIKGTLIGQGEASKMKKAKQEAAENGVKYLLNLADSNDNASNDSKRSEEMLKESETNCQELKKLSNLQREMPNDRKGSTLGNFKSHDEVACAHSDTIKKPFLLNKELLNNSLKKQVMLFDRTEELGLSEIFPTAALAFSAQMCRKIYSYNYVSNDDGTFRAEVLFDKEIFGTAVGPSKQAAKMEAAKIAFEKLQKQVYTVKVKRGPEEGYLVNREDMLKLKSDTPEVVSDDNIGCRMLKMMGWSGGGIGKMKGIAEPIRAGTQNFGTGLGYADLSGNMDMKNLKSEIESLLQEYSKSGEVYPLIFSMDFTKNERKEIHRIAQKYNLFNNSQGKGDSRRLFIKRKTTVGELLDLIIKSGGSTKKYELVDLSK